MRITYMFNFKRTETTIHHYYYYYHPFHLYVDKNYVVQFATSMNIKKEVIEYST